MIAEPYASAGAGRTCDFAMTGEAASAAMPAAVKSVSVLNVAFTVDLRFSSTTIKWRSADVTQGPVNNSVVLITLMLLTTF